MDREVDDLFIEVIWVVYVAPFDFRLEAYNGVADFEYFAAGWTVRFVSEMDLLGTWK